MQNTKILLRRVAELIVSNDTIWIPFSRTFVRAVQFLCSVRDIYEVDQIIERNPVLKKAFEAKKVLSGPFEGMYYGNTKAFCSALHPKVLGTYEFELTQTIQAAINANYVTVVDVGAADGYYAVGFALKSDQVQVIAFEQDERARRELAKLIKVNKVEERVEIREKCENADLLALPRSRGLMIMDCEGYEEMLLSPEVINHLKDWDFIVETHDGFNPEITQRLTSRFKSTHQVSSIEVVHDRNKGDEISPAILKDIPRRDVDKLLSENRQHACLRWIACESKVAKGEFFFPLNR